MQLFPLKLMVIGVLHGLLLAVYVYQEYMQGGIFNCVQQFNFNSLLVVFA